MNPRYNGKPFLELVDSFVLDAIGHLPAARDAALSAREAEFHDLFGEQGSWRQMVVNRMQFPDGMAGAIREMWEAGRPRFIETFNHEPDPVEFTERFIDSKFPH